MELEYPLNIFPKDFLLNLKKELNKQGLCLNSYGDVAPLPNNKSHFSCKITDLKPIKAEHTPIISEELFNEVQKILNSKEYISK